MSGKRPRRVSGAGADANSIHVHTWGVCDMSARTQENINIGSARHRDDSGPERPFIVEWMNERTDERRSTRSERSRKYIHVLVEFLWTRRPNIVYHVCVCVTRSRLFFLDGLDAVRRSVQIISRGLTG